MSFFRLFAFFFFFTGGYKFGQMAHLEVFRYVVFSSFYLLFVFTGGGV